MFTWWIVCFRGFTAEVPCATLRYDDDFVGHLLIEGWCAQAARCWWCAALSDYAPCHLPRTLKGSVTATLASRFVRFLAVMEAATPGLSIDVCGGNPTVTAGHGRAPAQSRGAINRVLAKRELLR